MSVVKVSHFSLFFSRYLRLLFFEVVIWLVKTNFLFLISLLTLRESENMKILHKCTLCTETKQKSEISTSSYP